MSRVNAVHVEIERFVVAQGVLAKFKGSHWILPVQDSGRERPNQSATRHHECEVKPGGLQDVSEEQARDDHHGEGGAMNCKGGLF